MLDLPVAIIGGGPAGLMAAEVLSHAGVAVHLFDAMPSVGRKFLLAGKGGLNLTHGEPADRFAQRYGARRQQIEVLLAAPAPSGRRRPGGAIPHAPPLAGLDARRPGAAV
jgi:hypothetical protein